MPKIRRTLLINTDPTHNPQAFLAQLNLSLQQVMEQIDIAAGDRGEASISSDLDMNLNSIINVGGISGPGINFDTDDTATTTSWALNGVEYATMGYENANLPVYDYWNMSSMGTLVMKGPTGTPFVSIGRVDSGDFGKGIIDSIGLQLLPGENGQLVVWNSSNAELFGYRSWDNEFTVGTDGFFGLFAVNAGTGELSIGSRIADTNFIFPTERGTSGDVMWTDANGQLSWVSAALLGVDRLTSTTNGYTLILSDNGTDMTLTGSNGDLLFSQAGADFFFDGSLTVGAKGSGTNFTFPDARGSADDILISDGSGLLSWVGMGSLELDVLTSSNNSYTLTLTDDGSDMTLTGSDGDLIISPDGDTYINSSRVFCGSTGNTAILDNYNFGFAPFSGLYVTDSSGAQPWLFTGLMNIGSIETVCVGLSSNGNPDFALVSDAFATGALGGVKLMLSDGAAVPTNYFTVDTSGTVATDGNCVVGGYGTFAEYLQVVQGIGVGTDAAVTSGENQAGILVQKTYTDYGSFVAGTNYLRSGLRFQLFANPTAAHTGGDYQITYGMQGVVQTGTSNRMGEVYGGLFQAYASGASQTIDRLVGANFMIGASGASGAVTDGYLLDTTVPFATGTFTDLTGLRIVDLAENTSGEAIGIDIELFSTGATTTLGIRSEEPILIKDKVMFTQTDGNEYIDSLADGYMDYKATTSHRFGADSDSTNYAEIKADGEINLHGTARVYKNQWISLGAMKAPGTKPAGETDYGISGAFTFDDGDDETVVASIRLPQDMDKTVAPEIKLGWGAAATTGDVVWQVEYLYRAPNEALDAAADDTLETTTTVSGTSDGLTISTLAMAAPGATDQLLLLRIKRLGADGDDDLSGDAYLVGCGLKYTADKLGAAT